MSEVNKIYLVRGNDSDMSVCIQRREGSGEPVPYDLSGAEDVRLSLTGHGIHVFAKNVSVTGASSNIITGRMTGRMLLGFYDLEVTFTLGGMAKRFSVPDLVEVVDHLEDDSDGEAEGEGDGIVVTLTIQPEIIEVAGITRDELNAGLALKVDKVEGKGLSTEDYTTEEKTKLGALPTDTELAGDLDDKVDKIPGKGLSESDYTTTEKTKLAGIAIGAQANVIETVKVGGASLEVVSKAVNIPVDSAPTAGSGNLATSGGIQAAIKAVRDALALIEAVVPTQASADNELADKEFVNFSISTNTAEFRGTVNAVSELPTTGVDDNDYAFVVSTDSAGNTVYNRYKFTPSNGWFFEYALNNSSFTSEQWAAIQSGMTAALVTKLKALPTSAALETSLGLKVDKVTGKGLSTNDFSDGDKAKLAALPTADALSTSLAGKVDKIEGKGLSTNDYTTTEKDKLAGIEEGAQVNLPVDETPTEGSDNPVSSGGMHAILTPVEEAGAEFLERVAPVNGKTALGVTRVKGRTLVWNQIIREGDFSGTFGVYWNCWNTEYTSASVGNNKCTATALIAGAYGDNSSIVQALPSIQGHKYYVAANFESSVSGLYPIYEYDGAGVSRFSDKGRNSAIFQVQTTPGSLLMKCGGNKQVGDSWSYSDIICVDLTLMFGAGNEPETVEEFEAMFPLPYYDYNPGELISVAAEGIETVGFNQWDEEWELGSYDTSTGEKINQSGRIRSANFIRCSQNTDYYFRWPNKAFNDGVVIFYDADKNFIRIITGTVNTTFTTPPNAAYMTWYGVESTYNHDICINLSDPDRNGEYEPYKEYVVPLGLDSFNVKDSEGNILEFNGLASAGDVYDEIIPGKMRSPVCRVRLSDLSWGGSLFNGHMRFEAEIPESPRYSYWTIINAINSCGWANGANPITGNAQDKEIGVYSNNHIFVRDDRYGTVEEFVAAMEGQWLYYERATPVEYDLAEPRAWVAEREDGGTETVLPLDSDPPIVPPVLDLKYGDYAEEIAPFLKSDLASASSVKAMLEAMKTAGVISAYTMIWNKSARRYDFTITQ